MVTAKQFTVKGCRTRPGARRPLGRQELVPPTPTGPMPEARVGHSPPPPRAAHSWPPRGPAFSPRRSPSTAPVALVPALRPRLPPAGLELPWASWAGPGWAPRPTLASPPRPSQPGGARGLSGASRGQGAERAEQRRGSAQRPRSRASRARRSRSASASGSFSCSSQLPHPARCSLHRSAPILPPLGF